MSNNLLNFQFYVYLLRFFLEFKEGTVLDEECNLKYITDLIAIISFKELIDQIEN